MLAEESVKSFSNSIHTPSKIAILTHLFPDADALGSSLALSSVLQSLRHTVSIIIPNPYPQSLKWMHGIDQVISAESNYESVQKIVSYANIILILDLSQKHRLGDRLASILDTSSSEKIVIDHHTTPDKEFARTYLHDTKATSTAEIVYEVLSRLDKKSLIDKNVAENLYTGIVTDTGSFRYPSTTSRAHTVAAELIDLGADVSKITENIQNNNSIAKIQFLGHIVTNKCTFYKDYRVAYVIITQHDLAKFHLNHEDSEYVLAQIVSITEIRVVIMAKQITDAYKISFRSKGDVSVAEIANNDFGGGGHRNASGGTFLGTEQELTDKVQKLLHLFV